MVGFGLACLACTSSAIAARSATVLDASTLVLELDDAVTATIGAPGRDSLLAHDLFVDDLQLWQGTCRVRGRVSR